MSKPRSSGGISGKGAKNVNPLYGLVQTASNYIKNINKEMLDVDNATRKYGWDSPQRNRQASQVRGAVFQARRYKD